MPDYKPYVRSLAMPCPRCEKLTIAEEALIDDDLTVYILFKCKACGEHWELKRDIEFSVEPLKRGGREPTE